MRFAHMADTHLGYRQYNLGAREQDYYDAFQEAIDKCLEKRVDVIVHSGDLFDSYHPPIKALLNFQHGLNKLNGKVKFLTVLGEHDIPKRKAKIPQDLFDIQVLGKNFTLESVEIDDVLFAGISNVRTRHRKKLHEELRKFDEMAENSKNSVLILHQAIKKYLPFKGAYQLTLDDLPHHANYYALGHIHATNMLKFGDGYLVYSGGTEIKKKDEISTWEKKGKGFYIVDIEDGNVEYEFIPLDIRPQLDLELEAENFEEVAEHLDRLDHQKKPMVNLKITGKDIDRVSLLQEIEQLLEDKVLWKKVRFGKKGEKEYQISTENWDLQEIFNEYFEDDHVGGFARQLFDVLTTEGEKAAIDFSNDYFEEEFKDVNQKD